uniref:Uncharacterized protein n=1 Tax=Triticum urartu TaxID=4572 RepID=A0A8R7UI78_TRIUA
QASHAINPSATLSLYLAKAPSTGYVRTQKREHGPEQDRCRRAAPDRRRGGGRVGAGGDRLRLLRRLLRALRQRRQGGPSLHQDVRRGMRRRRQGRRGRGCQSWRQRALRLSRSLRVRACMASHDSKTRTVDHSEGRCVHACSVRSFIRW